MVDPEQHDFDAGCESGSFQRDVSSCPGHHQMAYHRPDCSKKKKKNSKAYIVITDIIESFQNLNFKV